MNENLELLDKNLEANFIAALRYFDNSILESYKQEGLSETHDSLYETSCIGLEFCAFIFWVNILVSSITKYQSKNVVQVCSDELVKHFEKYALALHDNYNMSILPVAQFLDRRSKDYGIIYHGDYEPCGYYLLKDYPRYEDQLRDGLMRCSIAFGDFAVYYIKTQKRANFEDINPVIILDIFEIPSYDHIFERLTTTVFSVFNNAIKISYQYKDSLTSSGQNNNLTKPSSVKYVPSDQKSNSIKNYSSIRDNIIYTTITIAALLIVSMIIISFLI